MIPRMRRLIIPSLIILTSCHTRAPYVPMEISAPRSWKEVTIEESITSTSLEQWWEMFDDPVLNELEADAMDNNLTLAAAWKRVCEVRAIARSVGADLSPQLDLVPSYFHLDSLEQTFFTDSTNQRCFFSQWSLPLAISYEVDLWKKLSDATESKIAAAEASEEEARAIFLSLTAEVANHYFWLRRFDSEIKTVDQMLNCLENTLALIETRYKAGLVTFLDVTRIQALIAQTSSDKHELILERKREENILATLCGKFASAFSIEMRELTHKAPVISPGLPSTLLYRRPDIAQAEREMASLYAEVGATYATYFPSLSMTTQVGLSSPELQELLNWKSRLFSVAVNSLQTIFDGGRIAANVDAAQVRFEQTALAYEQRILTAFQEVEDALASCRQRSLQSEQMKVAVKASQEATALALEQYKKGIANYLHVIDAERNWLDAQRNQVAIHQLQLQAAVDLIKALGGGYQK